MKGTGVIVEAEDSLLTEASNETWDRNISDISTNTGSRQEQKTHNSPFTLNNKEVIIRTCNDSQTNSTSLDADNDEIIKSLWNAVCILGFRIYTKDQNAQPDVVVSREVQTSVERHDGITDSY
jgi:hypothetical protein